MTKTLSEQLLPVAKALKPRHIDLINRKGMLTAIQNRVKKLLEVVNGQLNPAIDLELKGSTDNKAVVIIQAKQIVVEVSKFSRDNPKYKEICEEALGRDVVDKMLAEKIKGVSVYSTSSETYKAKVLGPANI
jgi:hypothetical protein